MNRYRSGVLACLGALLLTSVADAGIVNMDGSEKNIADLINERIVGGSSSVDFENGYLDDHTDSYWKIANDRSLASVMFEVAGYRNENTFGIYDSADPMNKVELFAGADGAGSRVVLSIAGDGSVFINGTDTGVDFEGDNFGFYFDTPQANGTFYSDSALNDDGVDHMVAYQGVGEQLRLPGGGRTSWDEDDYILGLEDLYGGGDRDYQDMVVFISGVRPTPAPEPATLLLVAGGAAGVGVVMRRRRRALAG